VVRTPAVRANGAAWPTKCGRELCGYLQVREVVDRFDEGLGVVLLGVFHTLITALLPDELPKLLGLFLSRFPFEDGAPCLFKR
jgi:hypothetical protein